MRKSSGASFGDAVRAAHGELHFVHRLRQIRFARGESEDVVDAVGLEQAEASRAERYEDFIIGAAETARGALRLQCADHGELQSADAHFLADDRLRILDAELVERAGPEDRDARATEVVGRFEHAAAIDVEVANLKEVRGDAHDADVRISIAPHDLQRLVLLRLDTDDVRRAFLDRLGVIGRHLLRDVELDAGLANVGGVDLEDRRAERGDALLDGLLRAVAEGDHGDDGGDADHDAEHREDGTEDVGAKGG